MSSYAEFRAATEVLLGIQFAALQRCILKCVEHVQHVGLGTVCSGYFWTSGFAIPATQIIRTHQRKQEKLSLKKTAGTGSQCFERHFSGIKAHSEFLWFNAFHIHFDFSDMWRNEAAGKADKDAEHFWVKAVCNNFLSSTQNLWRWSVNQERTGLRSGKGKVVVTEWSKQLNLHALKTLVGIAETPATPLRSASGIGAHKSFADPGAFWFDWGFCNFHFFSCSIFLKTKGAPP